MMMPILVDSFAVPEIKHCSAFEALRKKVAAATLGGLLLALRGAGADRSLEGAGQVLEGQPLPLVEDAGLELVLVTEVRDGHFVNQVATQDGDLLFGTEPAAGMLEVLRHENLLALRNMVVGSSCPKRTGTRARIKALVMA
jgi:hypothetical protein